MFLDLDHYSGGNRRTYYKLGMGKSIGFGSIKLESAVTVFDSKERYGSLFGGDTWNTGASITTLNEYVESFTQYRDKVLGSNISSYKAVLDEAVKNSDDDYVVGNGKNSFSVDTTGGDFTVKIARTANI